MTSRGQQRIAAGAGIASVVCGAIAFFLGSTRVQGDDAAIVAVLRGLAAGGMLLLVAGARELVLRIEEHGERGRPNDTLATAVTVAGGVYAALQVVTVAGLWMAATRLDTLVRGSSSGGGADIGRFIAITTQVAAGFPAAVFAGAMSLSLFALGRAGTVVGLVGCAAAVASFLRGFAAYPTTVRELETLSTSVLFPVRDAMYVILTGLFGLFVAMLSVLVWLRADPREPHG